MDKCHVCGFSDHSEDAEYCQECGSSLINTCSNEFCDLNNGANVPIDFNAKYCPYCGHPSFFKESGYFDKE